jgi:hypothetical protein
MKVEKKSELIGRGGVYRRPVVPARQATLGWRVGTTTLRRS